MIFKKMKQMSDSVTNVAEQTKGTLDQVSESVAGVAEQTKETLNQTKKTLENSEKKISEIVDEFKDLSTLAKIGIAAVIGSNLISIAVGVVTLRRLYLK